MQAPPQPEIFMFTMLFGWKLLCTVLITTTPKRVLEVWSKLKYAVAVVLVVAVTCTVSTVDSFSPVSVPPLDVPSVPACRQVTVFLP